MTPERLEEITDFIERATGTNKKSAEICSMLRELEGGFRDQQQLETQDELIDQQRCRIGDLEDENQALRDECERLRERQVAKSRCLLCGSSVCSPDACRLEGMGYLSRQDAQAARAKFREGE